MIPTPDSTIATKLKEANDRLKAGNMGVSIVHRNRKLYLRSSMFPPKPGSTKTEAHRQELALDAYANLAGVKYAEDRAKLIAGQLVTRTFEWTPYVKAVPEKTVGDWIKELKSEVLSSCAEVTWRKDYQYPLERLPQDQPLTEKMMRNLIDSEKPNSKGRKRMVIACSRLARLAEVSVNFSRLSGNYGVKHSAPRDLPDDAKVIRHFNGIVDRKTRWTYGMMATYGIRPHEIFRLDLDAFVADPSRLRVLEDTKTGARVTYPFQPEWVQLFQLLDIHQPQSNAKDNPGRGAMVSRWFKAARIPFRPYNLRHAWAVRTIFMGLPDSMAARMMGHSANVHQHTYHYWITERTTDAAVAIALKNRQA